MRARGQQRELAADVNTESCVSSWLCPPKPFFDTGIDNPKGGGTHYPLQSPYSMQVWPLSKPGPYEMGETYVDVAHGCMGIRF